MSDKTRMNLSFNVDADVIDSEELEMEMEILGEMLQQSFIDLKKHHVLDDPQVRFATVYLDAGTQEFFAEPAVVYPKDHTATIQKIREIYTAQKAAIDSDLFKGDAYMRGMFNMAEVILSIIENRDAVIKLPEK